MARVRGTVVAARAAGEEPGDVRGETAPGEKGGKLLRGVPRCMFFPKCSETATSPPTFTPRKSTGTNA